MFPRPSQILSAIANSRHPYQSVNNGWEPFTPELPDEFAHLPTEELEEVLSLAITSGMQYEYDRNSCKLHLSKRGQRGAFKLPNQLDKAKEFIESIA